MRYGCPVAMSEIKQKSTQKGPDILGPMVFGNISPNSLYGPPEYFNSVRMGYYPFWHPLATPGRSFPEFDLITGVGLLISAQEWCQKVARHVLHVARAEYCKRCGIAGCYGVVVSVTLIAAL